MGCGGVGMPEDIAARINAGDYSKHGDSLGLQNVLQRLLGEYGPAFSVIATANPNQGTRLRLKIPLGGMGDDAERATGLFPGTASNLIGNQLDFNSAMEGLTGEALPQYDVADNGHRVEQPIMDIVLEPIEALVI